MSRRVVIAPEVLAQCPGEIELPEEASHYICRVLRLRPGDKVELIDGQGGASQAEICGEEDGRVSVRAGDCVRSMTNESPLEITLLVGLPKGQRWGLALEKSTELGVTRLWPVYTRFGQVQVPDRKVEQRIQRWSRIASGAARQSERALSPEVFAPGALADVLVKIDEYDALKLVAYAGAAAQHSLGSVLEGQSAQHVVGLVGPEGGFHADEIALCQRHGFQVVSLGPRVLRCETAAMVLTALIQHRLGDLG